MRKASLTFLACALAAGCAGQGPVQPDAAVPAAPPVASFPVEATAPAASIAEPAETPAAPAVTVATSAPAPKAPVVKAEPKAESKAEPQARATKQPEPRAKSVAAEQPRAKAEPKATAAVPIVAEQTKVAPAVVAERKAEPSLNVSDLTTGLRETHAIGTFTKLALKNQLDDLLQKFRSTHQSGQQPRAAGLRQPYDALVAKVLGLLQPGDPALARKIENSREGIWTILSDPEKFKSLT